LNAYFGKTEQFDAEKILIDFVGTYNVTSQLSLVLNFDWDQQQNVPIDLIGNTKDASWHAAALYVNYAINDQWRVSARGEYLHDTDGFVTGAEQTLKEGTLTVGFAPVKNFELRAEIRYDKSGSDINTFYKTRAAQAEGIPDTTSLFQFAIQGVYKFSAPPPSS
jgi:hypothetical protein